MNARISGPRRARTPNILVAVTALLLLVPLVVRSAAAKEPRLRSLATLGQVASFQPPSLRLDAMGGLDLAVRDEYAEVNLWDFAGVAHGVVGDRDSTSLDLWYLSRSRTLDQRRQGVEFEVDRTGGVIAGAEGILRFSSGLAGGVDAGVISVERAFPLADREYTVQEASQPVLVPVLAGRLTGPVWWGLRGLFGVETFQQRWWQNRTLDGRVELLAEGEELQPPNFFAPDEGESDLSGFGFSLGYEHGRWGHAAAYFDFRKENLIFRQEAPRHIYEFDEPHDVTGFGLAAIVEPVEWATVGLAAGRELWADAQEYRFTTSGGATSPPLISRGNRAIVSSREEFFRLRVQGDVPETRVTFGGALRVAYDRIEQSPATASPSDFNAFIRRTAAGDTLISAPLALPRREAVRTIEAGGGLSYRPWADRPLLVGGEYRWFRDAVEGTLLDLRPQGWEIRLGGEYGLTPVLTARAGYRYRKEDEDRLTALNELRADRATFGLQWAPNSWRVSGAGFVEWWRTDFPDPLEEGGTGSGVALSIGREF